MKEITIFYDLDEAFAYIASIIKDPQTDKILINIITELQDD